MSSGTGGTGTGGTGGTATSAGTSGTSATSAAGAAGAVAGAAAGAAKAVGAAGSFIQGKMPNKATWGLIGWIAGVIIICISMTVQLFTLSHGTSGQLAIDTGLHAALWPVLIAAILIAVGFTTWNLLSEHKGYSYPALFMLAFSSYIMANFAIFASTKQVTVATK